MPIGQRNDEYSRSAANTIMKALGISLTAFRQAHQLVWQPGIRNFLVVPVILSVVYFPILVFGIWQGAGGLAEWIFSWFPNMGEWGTWVRWILKAVVTLCMGFLGLVTYRSVVLIFYAPFLDRISEKVEAALLDNPKIVERNLRETILRVVAVAVVTIALSVVLLVADVFISGIPLIGGLVAFFVFIPIQLFVAAGGYIDPCLDRRGYGVRDSLRAMRMRFGTVVVFSFLSNLMLLVPFLGWFLGPTYSVVAGVVIGIEIDRTARLPVSQPEAKPA